MKNRAFYIGIILPTLLAFSGLVSGCSTTSLPPSSSEATPAATSSPTPSPKGSTVTVIQAYADPITENMLVALNNNDYASFSKDFDQTAKNAINATTFSQLHDQITATIGNYESLLFFGFSIQNINTTVSYVAHYTNEPAGVSVIVVFQTANDTHYVNGISLDSPKLRGQAIDVTQIQAYADPATENVLVSLSKDDYAAFSKDFDQTMKSAVNEKSFSQLYDMIKTKVGNYVSKEFESVTMQNNVATVKYLAKYIDEPSGVWVTISFNASHQVAGLFFNSPKINGQ